MVYANELYHHGIKGQRWGVRRYRNEDGSLTEAGKKREAKRAAKLEAYKEREKASASKYYAKQISRADRLVEKATNRLRAAEERGNASEEKLTRLSADVITAEVQRNAIKGQRALEMSKIKNLTAEDMRKEKLAVAGTITATTGIVAASAAMAAVGQVPVTVVWVPALSSLTPRAIKSGLRISGEESMKTQEKALQKVKRNAEYHDNGAAFVAGMRMHDEAVRQLNDMAMQAHYMAVGEHLSMQNSALQTHMDTTSMAFNNAMDLHNMGTIM